MNKDLYTYMYLLTKNQRTHIVNLAKQKIDETKDLNKYYTVMFYPDISVMADDYVQDLIESNDINDTNRFMLSDFASFNSEIFEKNKLALKTRYISEKIRDINLDACRRILKATSKEEARAINLESKIETDKILFMN